MAKCGLGSRATRSRWTGRKSRRNKYGAKPTVYNGVRYHSKAEATRAAELDLLVRAGEIAGRLRQVPVQLGEDFKTIVDFYVMPKNGGAAWYEEVKGVETAQFKIVRRLWKKYGPGDMRILKRRGNGWKVETMKGVD